MIGCEVVISPGKPGKYDGSIVPDSPRAARQRAGPTDPILVNIRDLIDDAKCSQAVRISTGPMVHHALDCSSTAVIKDGRDDTQPHRQRHLCRDCRKRFDDLTGTIFAGHHQPLRRARGEGVSGALIGLLLAPPRNPS